MLTVEKSQSIPITHTSDYFWTLETFASYKGKSILNNNRIHDYRQSMWTGCAMQEASTVLLL